MSAAQLCELPEAPVPLVDVLLSTLPAVPAAVHSAASAAGISVYSAAACLDTPATQRQPFSMLQSCNGSALHAP